MQRRTMIMAVLVIAAVISLYLGFQAWSLVAQSRYGQGLIVQVRLTKIQYVVDSAAINRGYFTANLTFQNPTTEILSLAGADAAYYELVTQGSGYVSHSLIAQGEINTTQRLPPGASLFSVRIGLNPYYTGNASLVTNTSWTVTYYPKFGLVACEMIATVRGSSVQTAGPYVDSSYNDPYTTLNTYTFSIIDTWAVALEIVAVSLILKTETQGTEMTSERKSHNVMLSVIYALQGIGFLMGPYYFYFTYTLVPRPPLDPNVIPYGGGGTGAMMGEILLDIIFVAGLVGLSLAAGLFLRWSWARNVAAPLSALGVVGWLYLTVIFLQSSAMQGFTVYSLVLTILFLVIAAGNGIVLYIIWIRHRTLI